MAETEKSLFGATAGHLDVTASEVQTGSGEEEEEDERLVLTSRGDARKTKAEVGQPVLVLVLRTACLLVRDLTRPALCHC